MSGACLPHVVWSPIVPECCRKRLRVMKKTLSDRVAGLCGCWPIPGIERHRHKVDGRGGMPETSPPARLAEPAITSVPARGTLSIRDILPRLRTLRLSNLSPLRNSTMIKQLVLPSCFRSSPHFSLSLALSLILFSAVASADNWPSWRGPMNRGISAEKHIPSSWSTTQNRLWRVELPGAAGATPVVWGDHIFLTTVDGNDLVLMCFTTEGELKWRQVQGRGNKEVRGDEGNSAAASPVTDGNHVWAFFADGSLGCYEFDGNQVWAMDVQKQYGKFDIQFGLTSTPVLHGDQLYLQLIHSGGAKVVALKKDSGEEVWAVGRESDAHSECEHSYSSPIAYDDGTTRFLLTHGADYSIAYDLQDGSEIWRVGDLHPPNRYDPTLRFVSSPVAVDGMIVVPSAKLGPTVALKPDGTGDITNKQKHYHWTFDTTPDVPSPLILEDYVYLCRENGNLICLDRNTGKQIYEQRTNRIRHRASPVYADGKIFLSGRDGKVTVVQPGPDFKILAQNDLEESLAASPAISNGRIYLRTFDALWAIGEE